jgi:hypothetical protein
VEDCTRLLKSFWGNVGTDDGDYLSGYTVEADANWIGELFISIYNGISDVLSD